MVQVEAAAKQEWRLLAEVEAPGGGVPSLLALGFRRRTSLALALEPGEAEAAAASDASFLLLPMWPPNCPVEFGCDPAGAPTFHASLDSSFLDLDLSCHASVGAIDLRHEYPCRAPAFPREHQYKEHTTHTRVPKTLGVQPLLSDAASIGAPLHLAEAHMHL